MNKNIWVLMSLSLTISGCQVNHSENKTSLSKENGKEAVTANSSNSIKDVVNKVNLFGGDTFDPEFQVQVKDYGIFDEKTNLSIAEDGDNVFVFWGTREIGKSGFSGSIATNGKWAVTDKNLFSRDQYSNWQRLDNYILTLDQIDTWTDRQVKIGFRKIAEDGTLSKENILAKVPSVSQMSIVPSSNGKVVLYSSDAEAETNDITFHVIPIEEKTRDTHSFTFKQFPEGGINQIKYIDFTNKKIYGIGKQSKGLLQVSMVNGEPLYNDNGQEKVAKIGEPVYISSNRKGEIEILWNDTDNLHKSVFDGNLNQIYDKVIASKNNLITVKGSTLHYWEVKLYKNRPTLNLKKIKI